MSEAEIQALCEKLIERSFDEDDVVALRSFIRTLKQPKVKKNLSEAASVAVVPEKKENQVLTNELAPSPLVSQDAPIFQKTQAFVNAVSTTTIERSAPVDVGAVPKISERKETFLKATSVANLADSKQIPEEIGSSPRHRDRIQNYETNLSQEASLATDRVKEAQEIAGSTGVKARLGNYTQAVEKTEKQRADEARAERLAEVKGAVGVKDRLGNWEKEATPSKVDLSQDRLSEVQGAPGVKDRLGVWTQAASEKERDEELRQARLADVKGASGVKDRLGLWSQAMAQSENHPVADPAKVQERLAEVQGATGVKDRLGSFLNSAVEQPTERKKPIELPGDYESN
eukprot:TRINITY_DN15510_c0_g1_i1.p1 TRINITY_DN15510_c0_g1~~TRINITY_DN15510_c0_g1_i1.p1  ORF type:complete len:344 (+),score=86.39 TRINITY_DN15510_c0_g1_i1:35-1066(+)